MNQTIPVDPDATLNQLVVANPAVLAVLHRHGLDTCCGGGLTLREAAARHSLDLEHLLAELSAVRSGA
jgi:regulator of cell morphogenesis and NO signaling